MTNTWKEDLILGKLSKNSMRRKPTINSSLPDWVKYMLLKD